MKLPGNEIGISDILAWRECPARFQFGMRRHDERGEAPESWSPANAYGSAIHHAIHRVDEGATEQDAVQEAFAQFKQWLEPPDIDRLLADLETYLMRDEQGVRTLVSEEDWRFPLFEHETEGTVYFRFKLDRLYQRLDDPSKLIHIDWKSGKWVKTAEDVDKDLQLWAYNLGIHEVVADLYPELEDIDLLQVYDQLRYGQEHTRKNAAQRASIKRWLVTAVTAMIADEDMAPTFNEWCPWCPIKMDCPVVQHELTDFALARIAALAPREPKLKKDGTPSKTLGPPSLDDVRFDEYVELLPDVKRARQTLEAFENEVKGAMKQIPVSDLAEVKSREAPKGYRLSHRGRKRFAPEALRLAHEQMGDDFYYVAGLSAEALARFYGDDKGKIEEITRHQTEGGGFDVVEPVR